MRLKIRQDVPFPVTQELLDRFWAKVVIDPNHPKGCWEWKACQGQNWYGQLVIPGGGKHHWQAHRASFVMFKGPLGALFACHKCDNRACVRPSHLFKGTKLDNNRDCMVKGRNCKGRSALHATGDKHWSKHYPDRVQKGSQTGRAKLTEAQVLKIRKLVNDGYTKAYVARKYNVSEAGIYNIAKRISWRHI